MEEGQRAGTLFSNDFSAAFMQFDFSAHSSSLPLGLVALWGALERLFATNEQELSFRVSANIAAYLGPAAIRGITPSIHTISFAD